jgi:hypothetical protein
MTETAKEATALLDNRGLMETHRIYVHGTPRRFALFGERNGKPHKLTIGGYSAKEFSAFIDGYTAYHDHQVKALVEENERLKRQVKAWADENDKLRQKINRLEGLV